MGTDTWQTGSKDGVAPDRARGTWFYPLILAVVAAGAHWGALSDGVNFDDYLHRANISKCGWSWHDLVEATTFDFPDHTMSYWWQAHPTQCRYPRPVFMLVLKCEYLLARGNGVVIDAFGLAWHALATVLVYRLARWGLGSAGWALVAGLVFALNPNGVFAVSWTAARNAILGALFLVAATSAYAAASFDAQRQPRALQVRWVIAAIVLWALSVFSRETAIMFPGLAVALDACFGGWRHAWRRRGVYVLLGALALAYVGWRLCIFPTGAFPAGYLETPRGLGYPLWLGSKLLQLVFALLMHLPYFALANPADNWTARMLVGHGIMLGLALLIIALYARFARRVPGRWFWPVWMVAGLAPTLAVSTMPHFAYLPFVGYAVATSAFLCGVPRRWQKVLVAGNLLLLVLMFTGHRLLWRAAFRAEQLIYADILDTTQPPPPPGSHLFFVNLPLTNTFTIFALQETWGPRDLTGHMLTVAPEGLRMERPCQVARLNEHELLVTTEAPGYFATQAERLFLRMTAGPMPFHAGDVYRGTLFDTTIVAMQDDGVLQLKFTFHEPLDTPGYYFYVCTQDRPAQWLRFSPEFTPAALAHETAAWRAAHADRLAERDRLADFHGWWRRVTRQDPAKTGLDQRRQP
jgi:hypothetical protein